MTEAKTRVGKIIHRAETRGRFDIGWLHSRHTFSFGEYYDAQRMGFGALRVLNDDIIKAGSGFGTHGHRDMEIISIPLAGALEHKDNMGNGSVIRQGEVQVMSAGTGVLHSEFNPSAEEAANFLQIWIIPNQGQVEPRYEQKLFRPEGRLNRFQAVVSGEVDSNSLFIHQQAWLSLADIEAQKQVFYHSHRDGYGVYFFVLKGRVDIEDIALVERDGLGITGSDRIKVTATDNSELLAIEVPL